MATLLSRSAVLLSGLVKRAGGVKGRYARGADDVDGVIGVPARSYSSGDLLEDVAAIDIDSVWIFAAADLVLAGKKVTPQTGDMWSWMRDDGTKEIYRVLPPTQGELCYRDMDYTGILIRVYMKHRESVENA